MIVVVCLAILFQGCIRDWGMRELGEDEGTIMNTCIPSAPVAKKLQAMHNLESPTIVRDVRYFLGFVNYYR